MTDLRILKDCVYKNTDGVAVLITGLVRIGEVVHFYQGVNQKGERSTYNADGSHNTLTKRRDIVERVYGQDEESFRIFEIGALFVTPGDRIWEVVAFSRCEKYPIIAKKLLPDGSFHGDIGEFDWNGKCLAGPHYLWKRVGP